MKGVKSPRKPTTTIDQRVRRIEVNMSKYTQHFDGQAEMKIFLKVMC